MTTASATAGPAFAGAGGPAAKIRYWLLTIAIMMATIMQILDTTIANVALPHMQTSLGATLDTVTWVLTSYIVASAIAIPVTGWIADRFGSRNLFLVAVGGFIIASMLCGLATSLTEMVVFRVFQGVFAAFIGPLSQTVMLDINPPEKHGQAMSIWGMGIMVAPIFGPVLGGWLTENYSWRWVFFVNVPVGLICFSLLWALLPNRPRKKRKFDYTGFALLAVGLASLQIALDRGQQLDWLQSGEIVIELGIFASAMWMFGMHIISGREPVFPKAMFADRNLVTALILMFVTGTVMFATMALLPPMLQRLYGYPVVDTGFLLAPRGVGVMLSMGIAGRLVGRIDTRLLIGVGFVIAALSLHMMTGWSLEMDRRPVIISGFVQGLGMGLVFVPLNVTAFSTLAATLRTEAASLLNLFRSLGASVGISIVTTMLARNVQTSHADLSAQITQQSIDAVNVQNLTRFGPLGDSVFAVIDATINKQALMIAYIDDFWLMMVITLLALPMVIFMKGKVTNAKAPGA